MTNSSEAYLRKLHQLLNHYFNLSEIQYLCLQLNIDYESVAGEEKPSRIRSLLLGLARNGRLPDLITLAQQQRPKVAWPPVPDDFELPESVAGEETATYQAQASDGGAIAQGEGATAVGKGSIYVGGHVGGDITQGLSTEEVIALVVELKRQDQPKVWDGRIPYLGLQTFQEDDAEFFFGREKVVNELLARLEHSSFLAIAGPSGSGKSSVARAGLLNALRRGQLERSERWLLATMHPGSNPLVQLAQAVNRLTQSPTAGHYIRDNVRTNPDALHQQVEALLQEDRRQRAILLVDQFEEIFSPNQNEAERIAFINLLATAAQNPQSRLNIILTLRSDFIPACADYPQLNELINQQFYQVGSMTPRELGAAIIQPALEVGVTIDPELVAHITADMKEEPGALPLMSFALRDLFQSAHKKKGEPINLTLSDYLQRGGIESALEKHAEQVFTQFSERQQMLARHIFSRLVDVGERVDTRRTATLDELIPGEGQQEEVAAVAYTLASDKVRLLTTDRTQSDETTAPTLITVTLAHEKLIDAWPWLRRLVDENQEAIALQNQIAHDAQMWNKEQDAGYLYRGGQLLQVEEKLEQLQPNLDAVSQHFIQASLDAEKQRQRTRRLVQVGGAVVLAILVMLGIGTWLINGERNNAVEARETAVAAQATSEANASLAATREAETMAISSAFKAAVSGAEKLDSDKELALLLASYALQQYRSEIVDNVMRMVLSDPGYTSVLISDLNGRVYANSMMAWNLNGDEILAWTDSGQVVAINPHTQEERIILNSFQGNINDLLFRLQDIEPDVWPAARQWPEADEKKYSSPNGQLILVQDETTTQLKRIEDNEDICEVAGRMLFWSMPWNVAGTQFFTHDQTVIDVWDTDCTHLARLTGDAGPVTWAEWNANGEFIAGVSETGHGRVWHLAPILTPGNLPEDWFDAWSPGGSLLATKSIIQEDNASDFLVPGKVDNSVWNIRIWDPVSRTTVATMPDIDGGPLGIFEWQPEDILAVVLRESDKAEIWDTETWQLQTTLLGHQAPITDLLLTPDGSSALTASEDGTVHIWDTTNGQLLIPTFAHPDVVTVVSLSPDGKRIATGSEDRFVRVWKIDTGEMVTEMQGHTNTIQSISWHPDGNSPLLLSEQADETILWDLTNGTRIPLLFENETLRDAYWNATGSFLAGVTRANDAVVWEVDDWSQPTRIGTRQAAWNRSLPASNLIATQGEDSSIIIWDAGSGQQADVFSGHRGDIYDINWNANGDKLATVGADATIHIWELKNPVALAILNTGQSGSSWGEWSADGRYFAHQTQGIGVTIYQIEGLADIACDNAVRNLSSAEIGQNQVNLSGDVVCPGKPVPDVDYDLPIVESSKG